MIEATELIFIFGCLKRKVTISILPENEARCNGVNECFSIPSLTLMLSFNSVLINLTRLTLSD